MIEKKALRSKMKDMRKACTDRDARNVRLLRNITESEPYKNAEALLCYVSFDTEADTYALLETALKDGKSVYVPYCVPCTNVLRFYRINSMKELHLGAFGILSPEPVEENVFHGSKNAVCVVPGLAFSAAGERLGYGRGFYDTFLEKADVVSVGFCFEFQLVDAVPTEVHDKRMDIVCTESGIIYCGRPMG